MLLRMTDQRQHQNETVWLDPVDPGAGRTIPFLLLLSMEHVSWDLLDKGKRKGGGFWL